MKTFYVSLDYSYEEIEVIAESREKAVEEAMRIIKCGAVTPEHIDTRVQESDSD